MADRNSLRRPRSQVAALIAPHMKLGGLALAAAAPIALVGAMTTRDTLLPTLSLGALALAAVAAIAAWRLRARRHTNSVTLWDVAGAATLIGCTAAMLSEPDSILKTFGYD